MGISEEKMKIVIDNYFKTECNIDTSIREAFEKGFRIGVKKGVSAQPEQRWIPVTERPPLERGYYLCSYKDGCVISTFWTGGSWYVYSTDDITAWMPMPEPYKGGEENGN